LETKKSPAIIMVQHDDHPQLHSEVDKQLSFNESFNADGDEEAIPKPDAMHRAVAREPWNQVSLQLSLFVFGIL
jgi:ABC-type Mn2+/Zn2+ transport system ATPase subunit